MAEVTDKVALKIIFRDQNEDLMSAFLTNGGKAIPKLIIIEKSTSNVLADWGPRPKGAIDLVKNYKEKFGVIDEQIKTDLQKWYLKDKGTSTQDEILALIR